MGDNLEAQGSHISRNELFEIYCNTAKTNRNIAILEYVTNKLNVPSSDKDLKRKIKLATSRFSSYIESKWRSAGKDKNRFQVKYREWLDGFLKISSIPDEKENFNPEHDQEASHASLPGRPEKSFDSCGEQSKRAKVRHLVENVPVNAFTYAAQMATRASGSRSTANLIKQVSESPEATKSYVSLKQKYANQQQYSPEEALAFYIDNNCTQRTYKNIRKGAIAKGHALYPSYHSLKNVKKQCLPPDDAISVNEVSARINLQQLLNITAKRLIEVIKLVIIEKLSSETDLTLVGKWVADGCSSQSVYKQKFQDASHSDESVFIISFVPIKLFVTNDPTKVIWQNSKCSSTRLCRPIAFVFAKETRDRVLIEKLQNLEVGIDTKTVKISYSLVLTMIDGKITNILTDNRDSQRCYLCGARAEQLNIIGQDRSTKTEHYSYGLSTLHAWIRFLEFCLKICYNIDVAKKPKEKKDDNDAFLIKTRKELVQKRFKSEMGLNIDKVTPGYGSSNDGNTARVFFKNYKKSAEITGVDEQLLRHFYIILSVMSSGYEINYRTFNIHLEETKKLYLSLYSWCNMTPTVHKILFHGLDVMKQSIVPIGLLSEEAQESRNKDFRRFRLGHLRKSSRENSNTDIINMLLVTSDPLIDSFREHPLKNIKNLAPEILEYLVPPQLPESTDIVVSQQEANSSFDEQYIVSDSTDFSDYDSD